MGGEIFRGVIVQTGTVNKCLHWISTTTILITAATSTGSHFSTMESGMYIYTGLILDERISLHLQVLSSLHMEDNV